EPAEPPEPLSGLLVLQPAVTTRAAMPSADRPTRAARVVFIIGLQDLVSYRMLRASYGSNPIGSRAGGLVPGPGVAHSRSSGFGCLWRVAWLPRAGVVCSVGSL